MAADVPRLERQKTNRKPVHGAANASKNRWRVLGTGEGGQRCETGCPLSPCTILFNIYIEELVREAVEDLEEGIKVGGRWIKALRFADDQAGARTFPPLDNSPDTTPRTIPPDNS